MALQLNIKDKARQHLRDAPSAVSGKGGHNITFRLAIDLVQGFSLSQGDALDLLREWNNRCQPPWSEYELKHKVEDAGKAERKKPAGWLCLSSNRGRYTLPAPLDFNNDIVISERSCLFPDHCPDGFSEIAFNNGFLIPKESNGQNDSDTMPEVSTDFEYENYYGDPF
jgi:hypothetical protein